MKELREYFEKTGMVYALRSKYMFRWQHWMRVFMEWDEAVKWLHIEGNNFEERELMTREGAISYIGEELTNLAEKITDTEEEVWYIESYK